MTTEQLVKEVLKGIPVLLATMAARTPKSLDTWTRRRARRSTIRGIHLVECCFYDRVDRVLLYEYSGDSVGVGR